MTTDLQATAPSNRKGVTMHMLPFHSAILLVGMRYLYGKDWLSNPMPRWRRK